MSVGTADIAQPVASRMPATTPWDERVASWETVAASPVFGRLADRVLTLADVRDGDVVVDLGAGTGLLTLPAARRAQTVHAIDYSAPMLERLAEHARTEQLANVSCVQADLRLLPLADESASIVVSSYAFHHLPHDAKELALSEARRMLRPGGRLVVCDMMFALSFRGASGRIVAAKITAIAKKGPAGMLRLARNAGRAATGRWEHPAPPDLWREMLLARHFIDVETEMVENEAGIATARRPQIGGSVER